MIVEEVKEEKSMPSAESIGNTRATRRISGEVIGIIIARVATQLKMASGSTLWFLNSTEVLLLSVKEYVRPSS